MCNKVKVNLGGVDFHLGLGFLMSVDEVLDFNTIGKDPAKAYKEVPILMFHSQKYACDRKGLDMHMSMEEIYDFIDENGGIGSEVWNDFQIAFYKSIFQNVPIDDKKKVVKPKK